MLAIGTNEPSGLRCSYRGSINDGNGLDDLLLVRLGTGTVDVADDSSHTGLVAHSGRQVDGLLGVIFGEAGRKSRCWLANILDQAHLNIATPQK